MFQLDSTIMDAIFEDGGISAYIVTIGEVTVEIPVFPIEAEKRTASVLWIWLTKLANDISNVIARYEHTKLDRVVITIFTISELVSNLGEAMKKGGYSIQDMQKKVEEHNIAPMISPEGLMLIVRDDLHYEYRLDENIWERTVTGLAIFYLLQIILGISEEEARKVSFEIAKNIPSKPKIETHATAMVCVGLMKN